MSERRPLSALLSQALIAFTIELDNEFERRMAHLATDDGGTQGSHRQDAERRPDRAGLARAVRRRRDR